MKNKYKITGFSRLLIFMIFFAPLAYIGASYYQGENGIENIKNVFQNIKNEPIEKQIEKKKIEIQKLENKLEVSKSELEILESQ